MTLMIPLRMPFDFGLTLEFLRGFSPMAGEQRIDGARLEKSWILDGRPVTVQLTQRGDRLVAELSRDEPRMAARIAAFVSADEDLTEFYAIAAADPAFAPVAERLFGLHQPKFPTPFEAACWAVLHQRAGLAESRARKAAIVDRFGVAGCDAFPEAETLAAVGEDELGRALGHPRKARAVAAVARAFAGVDEGWLREGPLAEVEAWLHEIFGVGEFSAGLILYRGLGRAIGLPWSGGFVEAAARTYPGCTRAELERRSRAYGPWRGHWALYLWAVTFVGDTVSRSRANRDRR